MHSLKVLLCFVCLTIGFRKAQAALGGATCTIPAAGSPGASTVCTAAANGFCLVDHLSATGSPVTAVNFDGVCVCYYGYSGPNCATASTTTTTSSTSSSSSTNTAVAAVALGGLAAYYLSQLGQQGQTALGTGMGADTTAQEALFLRQAGLPIGK